MRAVALMRGLLLIAATALAVVAHSQARAQTLVAGNPPLTQAMVDRVSNLLGEVVGQPFNAQQRERMRTVYVGHWRARKADEIETFQSLDELAQALPQATAAKRTQVLGELRSQLIPALRMAAASDPDARWLIELHDQAQRTAQAAASGAASGAASSAASAAVAAAAQTAGPATPARPLPTPPSNASAAPAAASAMPSAQPAAAPAARPPVTATAPGAPGLRFTAPPGWNVENHASGTVIFRRSFTANPEATHHGMMMLFPPQSAPHGAAAAFETEWRGKFGGADGHNLGDAVPHFRQRLPGGPLAYYMGVRAFKRINGEDQQSYLALWMVDLLDGRTQTVALNVQVGRMRYSMDGMNLDDAFKQFVPAVAPLLDSLRYADGRTSGPLFTLDEVIGNWQQGESAFGGQYVSAATGQSAGMAFATSGGAFQLGADGRYFVRFSAAFNNPVTGGGGVTQSKHAGRWALQEQAIMLTPDAKLNYNPNEVVVGAGVVRTPQGLRRMLITVGLKANNQFDPPRWFPLWNAYNGVMNWYTEER